MVDVCGGCGSFEVVVVVVVVVVDRKIGDDDVGGILRLVAADLEDCMDKVHSTEDVCYRMQEQQ